MKCIVVVSLALVTGVWAPSAAPAADQTILGRSLVVKNPSTSDRRKLSSRAKEVASPNTIVGDPTVDGAVLTVIANGANPTTQVFDLPQGATLTGKPFWKASGPARFKYKDAKGEQGAVRTVIIGKTPSGIFTMKIQIQGKNGPLDVVPPNPGTDAAITLALGGGDRYCLKFGPDAQVVNHDAELFTVRHPQSEDCPGGAVTTTTSTTTTTLSSPSPAFLD